MARSEPPRLLVWNATGHLTDTATAARPPRRCGTLAVLTWRPPSTVSRELPSSKHKSSSLAGVDRTAAPGVKRSPRGTSATTAIRCSRFIVPAGTVALVHGHERVCPGPAGRTHAFAQTRADRELPLIAESRARATACRTCAIPMQRASVPAWAGAACPVSGGRRRARIWAIALVRLRRRRAESGRLLRRRAVARQQPSGRSKQSSGPHRPDTRDWANKVVRDRRPVGLGSLAGTITSGEALAGALAWATRRY
jgi:hypothetical protein